jgi:hypothetical protein
MTYYFDIHALILIMILNKVRMLYLGYKYVKSIGGILPVYVAMYRYTNSINELLPVDNYTVYALLTLYTVFNSYELTLRTVIKHHYMNK